MEMPSTPATERSAVVVTVALLPYTLLNAAIPGLPFYLSSLWAVVVGTF